QNSDSSSKNGRLVITCRFYFRFAPFHRSTHFAGFAQINRIHGKTVNRNGEQECCEALDSESSSFLSGYSNDLKLSGGAFRYKRMVRARWLHVQSLPELRRQSRT